MPFKDRSEAGQKLALVLSKYKDQQPVILALPRGGVPVAAEVASALNAPLDLILVRKIGVPFEPELAMGAVVDGGAPIIVRNEDVIRSAGIDESQFKTVCDTELAEIERRGSAIWAVANAWTSRVELPSCSTMELRPARPHARRYAPPAHAIRRSSFLRSPSHQPRASPRCARRLMKWCALRITNSSAPLASIIVISDRFRTKKSSQCLRDFRRGRFRKRSRQSPESFFGGLHGRPLPRSQPNMWTGLRKVRIQPISPSSYQPSSNWSPTSRLQRRSGSRCRRRSSCAPRGERDDQVTVTACPDQHDYAVWSIRQSIARAIADQGRTIRIPVHMTETAARVLRERGKLYQKEGRDLRPDESSARTGMPTARVEQILSMVQEPTSLDSPIGEDGDATLGDLIEAPDTISPHAATEASALKKLVAEALAELTPREQRILSMRFGTAGNPEHTLEEVGRVFGVARERIRQIEAKALEKLRHPDHACKLASFVDG